MRPVETAAALGGFPAGGEEALFDRRVQFEVRRRLHPLQRERAQLLRRHPGNNWVMRVARLRLRGAPLERVMPLRLLRFSKLGGALLKRGVELLLDGISLLGGERATRKQLLPEKRGGAGMLGDAARQLRRSETGLVRLVVAVAAVADDVDHDIAR